MYTFCKLHRPTLRVERGINWEVVDKSYKQMYLVWEKVRHDIWDGNLDKKRSVPNLKVRFENHILLL